MKKITELFTLTLLLVIGSFPKLAAQAYNQPLTMQALNHTTTSSALSRSLGGVTLTLRNDASVMFANPAGLQSLEGIQISAGGYQESMKTEQTQEWYKLDWMPLFDLCMEGLTGDLPDPVIDPILVPDPTFRDSIPRNSRIPNWSRDNDQLVPVSFSVAVPFEISGVKMTAGAGFAEYANVDYYYKTRTAFSRNLDYITLPGSTNPIPESAEWFGDMRMREGSIKGYGGALTAALKENFSVGVSGLVITGSMEDEQTREGYGRLDFYERDFRYTPESHIKTWKGTSDISAFEMCVSSVYQTKNIILGFSIKPPTTITREFTTTGDSIHISDTGEMTDPTALPDEQGEDDLTLPWRGSIGLGITPNPNVFVGIEYKHNPYGSAEYTNQAGTVTKPWLDCSSFHVGVEIQPKEFLSLRFGYQVNSEVFESQGNTLHGNPISYAVYSTGFGIRLLKNIRLDFGYETLKLHYEDRWRLHSNVNKKTRHTVYSSISYTL